MKPFWIFLRQVKNLAVFVISLKNALKDATNEIEFNQKICAKTNVQTFLLSTILWSRDFNICKYKKIEIFLLLEKNSAAFVFSLNNFLKAANNEIELKKIGSKLVYKHFSGQTFSGHVK